MNNQQKLAQGICELSESKTWEFAKLEWKLDSIYEESAPDTCLCSKYPIFEICVLRNRINGNYATVGNVCVNKFIGLPSGKMFRSVKKVKNDPTQLFNDIVINFAFEKGWINKWEIDFYNDIRKKRTLTDKQQNKKLQINKKVLIRIINAKQITSN